MACFVKKVGLKVDKYATVAVNGVHYSVPDSYVAKKVDARIYTNRVEIYDGGTRLATHPRHYKQGEYVLDILHYLHTLRRKPGALAQSSALLQADARIKAIYEKYYLDNPKSFLPVLELINDIGVKSVEKALTELTKSVNTDLSAEKLRIIHEHLEGLSGRALGQKEDRLSRRAKSTLQNYDRLRDLQTRRAGA